MLLGQLKMSHCNLPAAKTVAAGSSIHCTLLFSLELFFMIAETWNGGDMRQWRITHSVPLVEHKRNNNRANGIMTLCSDSLGQFSYLKPNFH